LGHGQRHTPSPPLPEQPLHKISVGSRRAPHLTFDSDSRVPAVWSCPLQRRRGNPGYPAFFTNLESSLLMPLGLSRSRCVSLFCDVAHQAS
jgi:hypothetical protein